MKKDWLTKNIDYFEASLKEGSRCPEKIRERNKNLIKLLKNISLLPEKQRKSIKPMVERTLERHKDITDSYKIIDYYNSNSVISLTMKPK